MSGTVKRVPSIWTTGSTDILNTGTWRSAIAVHEKRPAPCYGACPVDGEIPIWVQQVRNEEFNAAWLTLVENNPIPAAIGRTCHRPCEGACNRTEYDGAVSINALEQYVGDMAIREGWAFPAPAQESQKMVAVIGGGPAGLSCAYQLRRKGIQVTIFDANPELGGVLRYGVPEYRLPKKMVAAEIERITDLGVKVVAGRKLTGEDLGELEKNFSAIFVAFGAHDAKRLPLFTKSDSRVLDGIDFLRSIRLDAPLKIGRKIVVIGGGSVAMDVAGSALRLGQQAQILALEGRAVMPAPEDEIEDVIEEGALLHDGAMVKAVEDLSGSLLLHCINVELDQNVSPGVIRPIEIAGTEFTLEADTVVLAIGQDPELADWEDRIQVSKGMAVVDADYKTSRAGVFAAGDVANIERFVSTAVGDGKRAAYSIARYLGHQDAVEEGFADSVKEVSFKDINTFYFPTQKPVERGKVDVDIRKAGFAEIRLGLTDEQALDQARRCFSCGSCIECDNCAIFCPDMAILKDADSPLYYKVLDQYCKGCGCCLEECPRGAMGVKEETK
ncbi:MAG: FAD-dependent oxidoreductase [Desulfuromonadales bacterium]|nr:FAD-dependent oxidoreductase [Desulfuromonadales bacterium]